jgi:hypothetical protein
MDAVENDLNRPTLLLPTHLNARDGCNLAGSPNHLLDPLTFFLPETAPAPSLAAPTLPPPTQPHHSPALLHPASPADAAISRLHSRHRQTLMAPGRPSLDDNTAGLARLVLAPRLPRPPPAWCSPTSSSLPLARQIFHRCPGAGHDRAAPPAWPCRPRSPKLGDCAARGRCCQPERDPSRCGPPAQAPSNFVVRPRIPRSLIRHEILVLSYQSEIQRVRNSEYSIHPNKTLNEAATLEAEVMFRAMPETVHSCRRTATGPAATSSRTISVSCFTADLIPVEQYSLGKSLTLVEIFQLAFASFSSCSPRSRKSLPLGGAHGPGRCGGGPLQRAPASGRRSIFRLAQ